MLVPILGAHKIVFKCGHLVGDDLPLLAVTEVELSLARSFPSYITLVADDDPDESDDK